jgi:hypothetical protein
MSPDELYPEPQQGSMPSHAGGAGGAVRRSSTNLAFPAEVIEADGTRTTVTITRTAEGPEGRTLYDHTGAAYRPRRGGGLGLERIEEDAQVDARQVGGSGSSPMFRAGPPGRQRQPHLPMQTILTHSAFPVPFFARAGADSARKVRPS